MQPSSPLSSLWFAIRNAVPCWTSVRTEACVPESLKNRIRGRARTALAVLAGAGAAVGLPENNTIAINDHQEFIASLANVLVGAGATNTLVVVSEKRFVEDDGIGTSIVQRLARADS